MAKLVTPFRYRSGFHNGKRESDLVPVRWYTFSLVGFLSLSHLSLTSLFMKNKGTGTGTQTRVPPKNKIKNKVYSNVE